MTVSLLSQLKGIYRQLWHWEAGEGRCQVSLTLIDTGSGLQGLLLGGEKPHIGGVVTALPRLSQSGQGWSADLFITPIPGHKDVEVAQPLAKLLAQSSQCTVVITAGIHSKQLTQEELNLINRNCTELSQKACYTLEQANLR